MAKLTQEQVKKLFKYNPDTGDLICKVRRGNNGGIGDVAGYCNKGYLQVTIDGKGYYNHRVIWLYVHGYIPEHDLDHINRKRFDNRIKNLREVSRQCNNRNCGNRNNNTSGVKGIFWHKTIKKWQANIGVNRELKHLGYYDEFDNAVCARLAGEQCVNWSGCDSSSPAFKYVKKNIIKTN